MASINKTFLVGSLLSVLLSLGAVASGDTLVQYNFQGEPGNQASTTADFVAPLLTASGITRGSGITAAADANSMSSSGWTTALTLDPNDYYQFVLTPNAGFSLNVDEIIFGERRTNDGTLTFTIRSSLDGFATDIIVPFAIPDNAGSRDHTFTLGAAFNALTSATTFRIYGYAAQSADASETWRLNNVGTANPMQINGSLAVVPEPATILSGALTIAAGAFGFVLHFRRKKD